MNQRVAFIAGATGRIGEAVVQVAGERALGIRPHVRPKSAAKLQHPNVAAIELDSADLVTVLRTCTTVIQLIGTKRARFSSGDTYETSDIGTTRRLVEAAKEAGSVDHLVLLSSAGAGSPTGAYLKAKATAERLVRDSGIGFTIVRPSIFAHESGAGFMGLVTALPGLGKYKPIQARELASAIVSAAANRAPLGQVLEGDSLWALVNTGMRAA